MKRICMQQKTLKIWLDKRRRTIAMTNTALLREKGDSKNWNFEIYFTILKFTLRKEIELNIHI